MLDHWFISWGNGFDDERDIHNDTKRSVHYMLYVRYRIVLTCNHAELWLLQGYHSGVCYNTPLFFMEAVVIKYIMEGANKGQDNFSHNRTW